MEMVGRVTFTGFIAACLLFSFTIWIVCGLKKNSATQELGLWLMFYNLCSCFQVLFNGLLYFYWLQEMFSLPCIWRMGYSTCISLHLATHPSFSHCLAWLAKYVPPVQDSYNALDSNSCKVLKNALSQLILSTAQNISIIILITIKFMSRTSEAVCELNSWDNE